MMSDFNRKPGCWWRIGADELELRPQQGYFRQPLPEEAGAGHSSFFQLEPGLNYIETRYAPRRDMAILSRIDDQEPRLVVTLGVKGKSRFLGYRGDELVFSEGYTTITSFSSSFGERHYEADKPIAQVRFSVSKDWLDTNLGEGRFARLFHGKSVNLISYRPMSSHGMNAAQQLFDDRIPAEVREVFRRGLALTILASELGPLCGEGRGNSSGFGQKGLAAARLAREILLAEFRNPPSVPELSRRVGINQFKLKQLFHEIFNSTPYGMLLDIRMNAAYRLLESTRCPISVAAEYVGYNHASNFSAAFTRYFGISPKTVSKNSERCPNRWVFP